MEVPVEPKLKKKAEKVLDDLGMDMNSAVRVFLKKVVATHSIPFAIAGDESPYRFTAAEEKEILKAADEAKDSSKLSGPFHDAEGLIGHLRKARA